ncbi:glutaminase [Aphanothece sacrum]|uniref:glutaminase n=1 Tax=Aphanothece sacrum FPU1 TaxID=1920663 RepID=A0A401IC10_APHSA|nr:glutaminase [Aphanothece sacrum]GBF78807.1 glutaminase [Aphanothece sacrum FPU1]GBF83039.1 glutaminase [Aphanothece sacrum FPU3]
MTQISNLTTQELSNWLTQAAKLAKTGKLPDYIPLLQENNPNLLAVCLLSIDQKIKTEGDINKIFPLMSIIKPFLLLYVLSQFGQESIFKKVGRKPSKYPFNSVKQIYLDQGFPRNPMINSGAITLASLLPGTDGQSRCNNLQKWLNNYGNCNLFLDEFMLESVASLPNMNNYIIVQELMDKGHITDPDQALDSYNHICCLSGTITDLAKLGLLLAKCPDSLSQENCLIVREIMTTCGLYEASADFAQQVGLPTKSGVSGAILSIIPEQGTIACYSPPLNAQGNSVASLFMIQKIAQWLNN